jgi:hypothetical protein
VGYENDRHSILNRRFFDRPADYLGNVDHLRALFCPNRLVHDRIASHQQLLMAEVARDGLNGVI